MSFISDIRGVSESAVNQLAERFNDLPRPLLAAIGAGDFAVERLAELREQLTNTVDGSAPSTGDVKEFAADLPEKAKEVVAEVMESLQKFATEAPAKTQHLVAELPEKLAELRESLTGDQLKATVDGYTQLAAAIYESLADRGDKTWNQLVAGADHEVKVVEATAKSVAKSATGAARKATVEVAAVVKRADVKAGAANASAARSEKAAATRKAKADSAAADDNATVAPAEDVKAAGTRTPKAPAKPRARRAAKPAPKPAAEVASVASDATATVADNAGTTES